MNTPDTVITLHPQEGAWLFVFIVLLLAASASKLLLLEINLIWWIPLHVFFVVVMLLYLLAKPFAISFSSIRREMEVKCRLGYRSRNYSFDELDSICSYLSLSGKAGTNVILELRLKTGQRIVLMSAKADWDRSAAPIGISGAREPQDLADLRKRISLITGVRNVGFCN